MTTVSWLAGTVIGVVNTMELVALAADEVTLEAVEAATVELDAMEETTSKTMTTG